MSKIKVKKTSDKAASAINLKGVFNMVKGHKNSVNDAMHYE